MQKHLNRLLAVLFAVSLAISISLFLVQVEVISVEIPFGAVVICALCFPVVPFLFLQLLLCKAAKRKWTKFLPLLVVAIAAMGCALGAATASGWDTLGYLLVLLYCASPAVGCVIGFAVDRFWRKRNYVVSARGYVLMVAFPLLVIALSIVTYWYDNLGVRTIYDIPSKESVVAAFDEKTYTVDSNDLIGYDRDQLHAIWGEPQAMLSGFWGDRWEMDDSTDVIVYYSADGKIEYVKIDRDSAYDNNRAAVTIEGKIYYVVGEAIDFESEEIEAMTLLECAVPYIESKPEAGYFSPDLEMKYAETEDGIVVLYMNDWFLCIPADTA